MIELMDECMDEWMNERTDTWMNEGMNEWVVVHNCFKMNSLRSAWQS